MAIVQITLSFDGMNVSAQVGDIAYYSYNPSNIGGLQKIKKLIHLVYLDITQM